MKTRITSSSAKNFDTIVQAFMTLVLMGIIMLAILGLSAIVHSLWFTLLGWAYQPSKDAITISLTILLCVVQLADRKER
jgi:hypothetical protein